MNCEQVEELLSPYLDDALAPEDRREVAAHVRMCTNCTALLAEFSRNDALLSHLPRVSPDPALRERIFSSPEFLELTGTFDAGTEAQKEWTAPRLPAKSPRQHPAGRPQLVALPGGRSTLPTAAVHPRARQRQISRRLAALLLSIAAVLIVAFAITSLLRLNFWPRQTSTAATNGAITPPTGPQQGGPLPAGLRVVYPLQGTLWSLLSDGSSRQADRLTPANVTVAENWVVSPAQAGSSAGDKLAYIDLQRAFVHVIRSDGQQDTVVGQPLLKAGIQPAAVWDTGTGAAILNSLAWSQDGSMLAFVADPTGTGQTKLYIYSTETGTAQVVPSGKGSVSHPVWSPDGARLAFEVTDNGVVSILD
ncbi:MAG TPA: zf-HC2 domain-containing protein, partial [Ktedonobacteraceae bacterium]|nr:zf-HC2 domain-containing protein [Ktedonobacteraceae bacterium]